MRRLSTVVLALVACTPPLEDAPWRVEGTRVLGIAAEPAEARPGEVVSLSALLASPGGTLDAAPQWSVCTRPRTAAERTSVTQDCLEGRALDPAAASLTVLPDACARFGPNVPPAEGDAARRRPADPDATGGYTLPVRAEADDAAAFGGVRIRCDLPGVTREIFEAFEERYTANENPRIAAVVVDGVPLDPDAPEAIPTSSGEHVIEVVLAEEVAEPYVRYESGAGVLEETREWLRVQWFVTDGELDRGQELITPGTAPLGVRARWVSAPGITHAWVVVTDARGGVTWQAFALEAE